LFEEGKEVPDEEESDMNRKDIYKEYYLYVSKHFKDF